MDDFLLADAISQGDQGAFRIFFERHFGPLQAYIFTLTGEKTMAEDIVQHAFFRIWEKRNDLKANQSPKNYLYTIAYHYYIDQYRKNKLRHDFILQLKRQALADRLREDEEQREVRVEKLRQIIAQLPDRCREILILNKMEGLKYREIAEKLSISEKTVESQMRIAFQKIREQFPE